MSGAGFPSASVVARRAQDADAFSTALVADMRVAMSQSAVAALGIGQVPVSLVMRRRANAFGGCHLEAQ